MAGQSAALSTLSLIVLILQIRKANSQFTYTNCSFIDNEFVSDSAFHQNLNIILNNLTSAASSTKSHFYNSSWGLNDDQVYGLYLCRGDLTPDYCSKCISDAAESIVQECPNQKESIKWVPECMLRYSNRNIFSKAEESPAYIWTISGITKPPNASITTMPTVIFNRTKVIFEQINETAFGDYSSKDAIRFYSTKEVNITGSIYLQMFYSLAQCTPDISQPMCEACLTNAYTAIRFSGQSLAYFPSCHLRYDLRKFWGLGYTSPRRSSPSSSPDADGVVPAVQPKPKGPSYIGIAIGTAFAVAILFLAIFYFLMRKRKLQRASKRHNVTMESLQYDVHVIKAAVNDFSEDNKLGHGGFGDVYKGVLVTGQEIAVKRLSPKSKQGIQEFKTEVLLFAKLQHRNLVRLLGFCVSEKEKLLIYEYLPYSSLDRILFDPDKRALLIWERRYKIIDGIAKGLLYLHEESRYTVIHRDLKPSNILLDKDMTPKISDFGMAKLFGENEAQEIISTRIVGTHGYMAPEYIGSGELSVKADVYSFGVLVLEIISGRKIRNRYHYIPQDEEGLLQCAWRLWNSEEPLELVDSALCEKFSAEEARRCIHIGLACTQHDANRRPTMTAIVSILSSYSNVVFPSLSLEGYSETDSSMASGSLEQSSGIYSGMRDITSLNPR